MLDFRTVLILVDDYPIVGRGQDIRDMPVPKQHAGGMPDLRIMRPRVGHRKDY
jgi:hypothetical protein